MFKKKIKDKSFLSDERCLFKGNKNLNEIFFKKYLNSNFIPIMKNKISFSKSAEIYQKEITNKPTFILMSVAEDGHIASIFLKSKALKSNKKIIFIDKKIKNYRRITVTLKYLKKKKKSIFFVRIKKDLMLF